VVQTTQRVEILHYLNTTISHTAMYRRCHLYDTAIMPEEAIRSIIVMLYKQEGMLCSSQPMAARSMSSAGAAGRLLMAAAVVFPAPVTDAAAAAAMRGGGAALGRWRLRVRHLAKGAVGSSGLCRSLTSSESSI
jgi:hypothetical protein